jgi:chromosomal replication initiation ATPase DnaA
MDIKEKKIIKPQEVFNLVQYELSINNLGSKTRTRELAQARFIYFKLARKFCRYASLSAIGKQVNRDHATVINGLKKYDTEAKYDPYMNDIYDKISTKLDKQYIPPGRIQDFDMTFERILKRVEILEEQLNKLTND